MPLRQLSIALVLLPLFGPPEARAEEHRILVGSFAFSPSRLTIQAGDTVTWVNTGGLHNVFAEDGGFTSGDAAPADAPNWPFVHRFDRPGVFPYVCVPHEFHGMRGVIEVEGPEHPGIPELAQSTFTATEEAGAALITIRRARGTAGAISVAYRAEAFSANPGNATAGTDFVPVAGTLHWADGDGSDRTFTVPLIDDLSAEGAELIRLGLSQPTGGATLDPRTRSASLAVADQAVALSAAEATCDAARLAGFLERAEVAAPRSGGATGLNLALTATGDFAGIAWTGDGPGAPEHLLAFSTNPEETPLLRDPGRLQLLSLSLTRNPLASDLVPEGDAGEIRIAFDPTLRGGAEAILQIDNLATTRGRTSDAKPGRGLAALAAPCHRKLSDQDLHVLRVLSRLARASAAGARELETVIFRGEEPQTYRIDVYPLGPGGAPQGRLAVEVRVTYGASGSLFGGVMRLLERCSAARTTHCTSVTGLTELALVPPAAAGDDRPASDIRVFTLGREGDGQPERPLDWGALLAATAWKRSL